VVDDDVDALPVLSTRCASIVVPVTLIRNAPCPVFFAKANAIRFVGVDASRYHNAIVSGSTVTGADAAEWY
jgi:hypothetical protein